MKWFNENLFAVLSIATAAVLAFFAGQITHDNLQIVAVKGINVAILLGTSLGFMNALRGTKYDVVSEIFDQNNIAAAIFTVGFVMAIAMSLTVVS